MKLVQTYYDKFIWFSKKKWMIFCLQTADKYDFVYKLFFMIHQVHLHTFSRSLSIFSLKVKQVPLLWGFNLASHKKYLQQLQYHIIKVFN